MPPKFIQLFMWGYQPHFRVLFEHRMVEIMNSLGVPESGAECLLVGARIPGHQNPNAVCIEPENEKWQADIFEGLLDLIEKEVAAHPLQKFSTPTRPACKTSLKIYVEIPCAWPFRRC